MHYRIPHTFRAPCGVDSSQGVHWTSKPADVTCLACVAALQSTVPTANGAELDLRFRQIVSEYLEQPETLFAATQALVELGMSPRTSFVLLLDLGLDHAKHVKSVDKLSLPMKRNRI